MHQSELTDGARWPNLAWASDRQLIKDHDDTADYLASGLTEPGRVVDGVPDGRTGLFLAGEGSYDVLIVDRLLPGMDGLDLVLEVTYQLPAAAAVLGRSGHFLGKLASGVTMGYPT